MRIPRIIHPLLMLCVMAALTGCSRHSELHVPSDPGRVPQFASGKRVRVDGYTRGDGRQVDWKGYVSYVPPDSLCFDTRRAGSKPKPATFGAPRQSTSRAFTVAADSVAALDVVEFDYVSFFVGLPLVYVAVVAAGVGVIAMSGGSLL